MHSSAQARIVSTGCAALFFSACAEPPQAAPPIDDAPPAMAAVEEKPPARAGTLPGRVTRIPLGDLFAIQQSGEVLIYDVRPAFFYSLGHIPGSVNWPKSAYARQLATRDAEIRTAAQAGRPVVLYCTDMACPDARDVATWLAARGHDTRVLEGGWEAWKVGGLPGS